MKKENKNCSFALRNEKIWQEIEKQNDEPMKIISYNVNGIRAALKKGFLPAGFKEDGKMNKVLNTAILNDFEKEFKELIKEIFDSEIPFQHKDRDKEARNGCQ